MAFAFRRPQFVFASAFLMSFGMSAAGLILPLLAKEQFGAGPALLGFYGLAFNLLYVPAALCSGRLYRRFGFRALVTLGAVALAVVGVAMLAIANRYLALAVCLLQGLSGGVFWPAVEGMNAEGQTAEQIKRGAGFFSFAWVSGMVLGFFLGGWLYGLHPRAPFLVAIAVGLAVIVLAARPASLAIAAWGAGRAHNDAHAPLERRRRFVRLAFLANFGMWTAVSCARNLLPEYAVAAGITGWRYGLIMAVSMIGFLASNALLIAWHGWHYSGRALLAGQLLAAGALAWFTFTDRYLGLCGAQFVIGCMMALTYFSSIYYGMELSAGSGEQGGAHGGRHEAVIGLATGIGPVLGGWLIAASGQPRSAFLGAGVFMVALVCVEAAAIARWSKDDGRRYVALPPRDVAARDNALR